MITDMIINSKILKTSSMKNHIKKIIPALMVTAFFVTSFTACVDEPDLQLPYLFRPINLNVEMNKTVATVTWAAVDSAVSYTLQLSTDGVNYTNLEVDTTLTGLTFTKELAGETDYFVRVRANHADSLKNSKYNSIPFRTPAENIFQGFGTSNNTGKLIPAYMTDVNTLTIKWTPAANVTHLILSSDLNVRRDSIVVTPEEALAGQKVVNNLPKDNWYVKIYNNKIQRGKTYGLVEGDVVVNDGEDLGLAITNATAGQVILVKAGAVYKMGSTTFRFGKNVKVRGLSSSNLPVLCLTAGTPTSTSSMLGFVDASVIDYVKFENIDFTGYCDNNNAQTKIGYLFNNNLLTTVKNLSFTNCKMHNFGNTPMRVQGAKNQVIDTLNFTGCVVNDIGFSSTYAIVNSNSADFINNINMSYCTFYMFKGSLVLRQNQTLNSINITNCTINQGMQDPGSTRFLIDCNGATVSSVTGITIKNCIFGQTGSVEKGAAGIRTTGVVSVTGSYYTSDYVDNTLVGGIDYSKKSSMTPFAGLSKDLWNGPVAGDFTLKASTFAGKNQAGDLRWY
jgi:hypothetical protein